MGVGAVYILHSQTSILSTSKSKPVVNPEEASTSPYNNERSPQMSPDLPESFRFAYIEKLYT